MMMKAAIYKQFGKPEEVLKVEQIPIPKISPNQILVQVKAASINPVDWKRVLGYLSLIDKKLPYVPCEDLSGVVVEVGANCKRIQKGDKIIAKTKVSDGGAIAEYAAFDEDLAIKKPNNVTFEEAASFPLAALTSYQALLKAQAKSGSKVLVLGGSGGCGNFAVQIAKHFGCIVTTTCSGKNEEFVKGLGADQVIDYTKEEWSNVLKGQNYDVIYDTVGGGWPKAHEVSRSGGSFVTIAGDGPGDSKLSISAALLMVSRVAYRKLRSLTGGPTYDFILTQENLSHLEAIGKMVEEGALKPTVDKVYPLDKFVEGFLHSQSGRTRGKVVFSISNDSDQK